VLEIKWNSDNKIVSASADKSVALWDANAGSRIRKLTVHSAIVNSCSIASDAVCLFASGSEDCTAIAWDTRDKNPVATMYHDYQVLTTALTSDGLSLFTGGVDNVVRYVVAADFLQIVEDSAFL
jgi:WD40 repeat protein